MAPAFLAAFCGSTVAAISIMGGVFAVLPAYEADLYGPKYVQAIHGRFLLAATVSTIAGPLLLLNLRKAAEASAMKGECTNQGLFLAVTDLSNHKWGENDSIFSRSVIQGEP